MEQRIPKTIHYCWFGKKEKPSIVNKCLASWREHLTNYAIKEWNEDNFDMNCNQYVQQAFQAGKFAFVSDYVRVYALYNEGGIYLDTDVEVFRPFDNLLHHDSFWGFEQENFIATSTIGAAPGNMLIKEFLDSYETKSFLKEDGSFDQLTNVAIVTEMFVQKGLKKNGNRQTLAGLGDFFPQTYFSPYDYINCRTFKTNETYAMHHFYKSWLPRKARVKGFLKVKLAKVIGGNTIAKVRNMYK